MCAELAEWEFTPVVASVDCPHSGSLALWR